MATLFLLCREILKFNWLVNWLGAMVQREHWGWVGIHPGVVYIHTYAKQTR